MSTVPPPADEPPPSTQPVQPPPSVQPSQPVEQPLARPRPRNGLGVAALVIGVASLVATLSFVLFPLALIGSVVGLVVGLIALTRGRKRGATNQGQAVAGVICCAIALAGSIALTVRVGTWAARNTG